jgi:hypothetical protein
MKKFWILNFGFWMLDVQVGGGGLVQPLMKLRTTETTDLKRKQEFEQKATKATKNPLPACPLLPSVENQS